MVVFRIGFAIVEERGSGGGITAVVIVQIVEWQASYIGPCRVTPIRFK